MKKAFPGHFSNDPRNLEDIWGRCIFVLDTNVLLNLYRYSDETRSELLETFRLLKERLWIPYQVASDYFANRVSVIGEQVKVYERAINNISELRQSLESQRQHPFVQKSTLIESTASFEKIISELTENQKKFLRKIEFDDVKDSLEVLLDGRVGRGLRDEEVSEILSIGAKRYAQKRPPGYMDANKLKSDSEVISEKLKPYADYVVWRQTIAMATAEALPVIFVTGDRNNDWWSVYNGKLLGPHPLLVEEFVNEVGQPFLMYLPEKFMQQANGFLERETSQSAVDEIVEIRSEELPTNIHTQ